MLEGTWCLGARPALRIYSVQHPVPNTLLGFLLPGSLTQHIAKVPLFHHKRRNMNLYFHSIQQPDWPVCSTKLTLELLQYPAIRHPSRRCNSCLWFPFLLGWSHTHLSTFPLHNSSAADGNRDKGWWTQPPFYVVTVQAIVVSEGLYVSVKWIAILS